MYEIEWFLYLLLVIVFSLKTSHEMSAEKMQQS